jgi:preprotein translocase subunit SecD
MMERAMFRFSIVIASGLFALPSFSASAQTQPTFALHLAVYISAPCGGADVTKPSDIANNREGLCFRNPPILTERDVETAELHRGSKKQPVIFLTFHEAAAMRELNETKANVGKRVGIVIDGRLMSSPEIPGPSRFLFIDAGLTDAQTTQLVTAFQKQSLVLPKH